MLLRPYEGAEDKHMVVGGDEVLVDRGTLTPLALVFHELATNSAKYGALNNTDGTLSVHVSRSTDDLHVKWTETAPMNAGYCDIADGGFGSKLLDITINEHLQGSYTRTYTEDGTEIEIILPGKLITISRPTPRSCHRRSARTPRSGRNLASAQRPLATKLRIDARVSPCRSDAVAVRSVYPDRLIISVQGRRSPCPCR